MSRKPKPKDGLTAHERVLLRQNELEERSRRVSEAADGGAESVGGSRTKPLGEGAPLRGGRGASTAHKVGANEGSGALLDVDGDVSDVFDGGDDGEAVTFKGGAQGEAADASLGFVDIGASSGAPAARARGARSRAVGRTGADTEGSRPLGAPLKPSSARINVDLSLPIGKVTPLHGAYGGPVSYGSDLSGVFRELGVPTVRCASDLGDGRPCLLDICEMIGDATFEDTRDGFDFSALDRYVDEVLSCGAEPVVCVCGFDRLLGKMRDGMSSDELETFELNVDAAARACVGALKHIAAQTERTGAGVIRYFEIECEGCDPRAYLRIADAVRFFDGNIKVGVGVFDGCSDYLAAFVKTCRRRGAEPAFVSVATHSDTPVDAIREIERLSAYLKKAGWQDVEILIASWGFSPLRACGFSSVGEVLSSADRCAEKKKYFELRRSVEGAAYALSYLIKLADLRAVKAAHVYDCRPFSSPFCPLTDAFGNKEKPFYALRAYGEVCRAEERVHCEVERPIGYAESGVDAIAAVSNDGVGYCLISVFDGCSSVDLRLDGINENAYTADVYMLDGVKDMSLVESVPISGARKRLVFNVSGYAAILVKVY